MDLNFYLTALNILVAFLGILFVISAFFEYRSLARLRNDFERFKADLKEEIYRVQKSQQRVISSYSVTDLERKIALLKSAVEEDPRTFNGFNALGYAYLEKGNRNMALDAFRNAVEFHPDKKEGYFDLSALYFDMDQHELAVDYLRRAIKADESSIQDIKEHPKLSVLSGRLGI